MLFSPPLSSSCSQMALFYISGCIDTGSCSQTQRPLTHQSKKLLCSAAPHHTKVISVPLSLHLLCALSPTSFSELILLHKIQSCLDSLPFSVQSFSDWPTLPRPSHSLFLFNVLLPCLRLHPLPLYPLQLRFSSSLLANRSAESRIFNTALQATACVLTDFRSDCFKGVHAG